MTPNKPFDQMNATEKTKVLGFRSYSERELKLREKKFAKDGSDLTVFFLRKLLSNPDVAVDRTMNDVDKQKMYQDAINDTYNYAFENGYSLTNVEAVARNIQDLGAIAERMANFANGEYLKLSYALTGENKFEMAPLSKIESLRKVASEVFPKEEIVEDEVVEEVAPVVEGAPTE